MHIRQLLGKILLLKVFLTANILDMRFGRNVTRTIFEYYRFTNVLAIPLMTEIHPRKGRPKTHRPRGRSRVKQEVKLRPKTTRINAPIR